jgi:hypothetical protein
MRPTAVLASELVRPALVLTDAVPGGHGGGEGGGGGEGEGGGGEGDSGEGGGGEGGIRHTAPRVKEESGASIPVMEQGASFHRRSDQNSPQFSLPALSG